MRVGASGREARQTMTPLWKGIATLAEFRTLRNYRATVWLLPRVGDKLVFAALIASLYPVAGSDMAPTNMYNLSAALFMWAIVPAFGAAACAPAALSAAARCVEVSMHCVASA
jgi:ATP-binding cassette, subfamily G (WHITE), member 2